MHVTFVALGQEQLGISQLSAVLRANGHETSLVFDPGLFADRWYFDVPALAKPFDRTERVVDEVVARAPDLVAFSVLTPMYTWSVELARRIKDRLDVPIIFGGVHPSAVPDVCLEEDPVDFVCVGEGERAIVALCDALARGEDVVAGPPIDNLCFIDRRGAMVRGTVAPFIQDLDALPLPDKDLWEDVVRFRDNYMVLTARGCPYRCTFCFNNYFATLPGPGRGKYVRQRSVDAVLYELRLRKARYRFRHVEVVDDIFTLDTAWLRRFLPRFKREIGVPFSCLVHPRFIDDEVAGLLRDAGCDRVQMGIQSADPEYKRSQLLRMEKEPHVTRALDAMSRAGLPMKLDHMFGLPGEPRSAQERAVELFRAHPPARINTYWLSYLPGTEILDRALREGVLTQDDADAIARGRGRTFHHGNRDDLGDDGPFYQRYEMLFRILPLLPVPLRRRITADHMPDVSPGAADAFGFVLDAGAALFQNDAETWIYGRHYAHHVGRAMRERLSGVALPSKRRGRRPVEWAPRGDVPAADVKVDRRAPHALPMLSD